MHVVVIGGGGREQAIAWACGRHGHQVSLVGSVDELDDIDPATTDLVIPGPEAVLAAGAADRCAELGVPCFGPPAALAALETSKGYARSLAAELGIPGPAFARFAAGDVDGALAWWRELGAAGGRQARRPRRRQGRRRARRRRRDGGRDPCRRGRRAVRARGADDRAGVHAARPVRRRAPRSPCRCPRTTSASARATPARTPAAWARTPRRRSRTPPSELLATFVQPVLDHFAAAGTPYVGVIYAGLMLTPDGPRLVEYNVRFGDPETQAVLPLLRSDLAALALAATQGDITTVPLELADGAACTVVAATAGYPTSPRLGDQVLTRLRPAGRDEVASEVGPALLFPAGLTDGVTTGGRVLAVTGLGADLAAARDNGLRGDGRDLVRRDAGAARHRLAGAGRRAALLRRRRRRHRRGQPRRRPAQGGRRAHPGRRGRARRRQLRRGVLGQGADGHGRPDPRRLDRRRRHEGRAGGPAGAGPRHRHGHRQPLRRRRPRAVRPAAVLPRLHRRQHARRRPRRRGRQRDGRGVRSGRLHAARRRDGRDAGRLRARRVRHRRHARRRRRALRSCSPAPTSRPATC